MRAGVCALVLRCWRPCFPLGLLTLSAVSHDARRSRPSDRLRGAATPDRIPPRKRSLACRGRSELLERMGVGSWHARGWRGRGLKVAVLDSGFQRLQGQTWAQPSSNVKVHSSVFDGNLEDPGESARHTLCAEVDPRSAPEAAAAWPLEPEHPINSWPPSRWALCQEGAAPVWPPSSCQPGAMARARPHPRGIPSSRPRRPGRRRPVLRQAGNTAQRHWSGPFREPTANGSITSGRAATGAAQTGERHPAWGGGGRARVGGAVLPAESGYEVIVSDTTAERR